MYLSLFREIRYIRVIESHKSAICLFQGLLILTNTDTTLLDEF